MSERRVALVTGGAKGIGAAIAARLVRDGFEVVVADREPAAAGTRPVRVDVSVEAEVVALVEGIARQEGRLDALVCNAGFGIRRKLRDLTLAEWSSVLATNLTSTFLLARAAEAMLRRAKGAIVTIASTRAHMSEPDMDAYAASKGGLVALTHSLAVSFGPDVRAELRQSRLDRRQGRNAAPRGPCTASRRPCRQARGHRGDGGVAGGAGERIRDRRRVHERRWDDAKDDLRRVVCSFLKESDKELLSIWA